MYDSGSIIDEILDVCDLDKDFETWLKGEIENLESAIGDLIQQEHDESMTNINIGEAESFSASLHHQGLSVEQGEEIITVNVEYTFEQSTPVPDYMLDKLVDCGAGGTNFSIEFNLQRPYGFHLI